MSPEYCGSYGSSQQLCKLLSKSMGKGNFRPFCVVNALTNFVINRPEGPTMTKFGFDTTRMWQIHSKTRFYVCMPQGMHASIL